MRIFLLLASSALLTAASAQVTPLLKPFPDVPPSHPSYEAILYLQANGVVQGNPDGSFRPDITINRAEFTKILVESIADQEVIETCMQDKPVLFKDVYPLDWYAKYICVAKKFGMAFGNPDGTYRPVNAINFAEAATLLARNLGVVNQTPQPIAQWYQPFIEALGFEHAIPLSITRIDKAITRAEMAEIIYRIKADIPAKPSQTWATLQELAKNPPAAALPKSSSSSRASVSSALSVTASSAPGSSGIMPTSSASTASAPTLTTP
jgi:hypothetical protein